MTHECVRLSEELFLMCTPVSTTVEDKNTTKLKGVMKNEDIKRRLFLNLHNFYIHVFFVNSKIALLVVFVKYIFSKLYSYCTQNINFYCFFETIICFGTKNFSISSQVYVFIFSKNH